MDPYKPTSIMESNKVFFSWLSYNWWLSEPIFCRIPEAIRKGSLPRESWSTWAPEMEPWMFLWPSKWLFGRKNWGKCTGKVQAYIDTHSVFLRVITYVCIYICMYIYKGNIWIFIMYVCIYHICMWHMICVYACIYICLCKYVNIYKYLFFVYIILLLWMRIDYGTLWEWTEGKCACAPEPRSCKFLHKPNA